MLKQAELKMRQLLFDDSGIAMAYTIMVFLVFFMICISTYAMSENIRLKMELQNACDSAAYSVAVAQADMLSRIAVLNRALSWTYAETNKRQMDETVYDWLYETLNDGTHGYYQVCSDTRIKAGIAAAACRCLLKTSNIAVNNGKCNHNHMYWVVGRRMHNLMWGSFIDEYEGKPGIIVINNPWRPEILDDPREKEVSVTDIENAFAGYSRQITSIENGISNVEILNQELAWLVLSLSFGSFTDTEDGGNIRFAYQIGNGTSYLERETNEEKLMNFSGKTVSGEFKRGCDVWWVRQDLSDNGIGRNYTDDDNAYALRSRFEWSCLSHWHDEFGVCQHSHYQSGTKRFQGRRISETAVARPWRLKREFFGEAGTIMVTATLQNSANPLPQLFGASGIYSGNLLFPYQPVAVSAARAGIRLKPQGAGEYSVFYPGDTVSASAYMNGVWNLCEEDWDAVMLPISRAWCPAPESGQFDDYDKGSLVKYSSDAILEKAYELLFGDGLARPANVDNFMRH